MGIREPSLSSSRPPSISSSVWLRVEVSDLLNHVFPIELKLESKNPLSQETFSQFWTLGVGIWVQGNLPSLPHDLPQFLLLCDCGSKFQTCYVFYAFSALLLLAFWFSLVKAPLAFVFYTLWIWGLILHKQTLLKNPRGDLGRFRTFGPCHKNVPDILATSLGNQAAETREVMYSKIQNQQGCFSHQLIVPREIV